MPYTYGRRRRAYPSRRRTYSSRARTVSPKAVASIARREIRREDRKDHPLQWVDIHFTGGNVNTTPTMHSFLASIRGEVDGTGVWDKWPQHNSASGRIYQSDLVITMAHYQLRFQQDVENIESSNTFRTLSYSFLDTFDENNAAILSGLDIDSPPNTEKVQSMYFDHMRALRAGTYDPPTTDESDPTPGTSIIKVTKRIGKKFTMWHADGGNTGWDNGDVRWEAQSDTVGDGLQLYGFIRVYYRILS